RARVRATRPRPGRHRRPGRWARLDRQCGGHRRRRRARDPRGAVGSLSGPPAIGDAGPDGTGRSSLPAVPLHRDARGEHTHRRRPLGHEGEEGASSMTVADAFAPWAIDPSEFPEGGSVGEQLAFLLRYAVLAPSTHNTQPWRFRVDGPELEV